MSRALFGTLVDAPPEAPVMPSGQLKSNRSRTRRKGGRNGLLFVGMSATVVLLAVAAAVYLQVAS